MVEEHAVLGTLLVQQGPGLTYSGTGGLFVQ